MKELLFIDIETTAKNGPEKDTDAIIEIAAAKVNLETRESYMCVNTVIYPENSDQIQRYDAFVTWDLGEYHIKSGRFNDVMFVMDGEPLRKVLKQLSQYMEGATIAGQNPHFDLRYLKRDFDALNLQFPKTDYHVIDLCSPALFLYLDGKIPGLGLKHSGPWAECTDQTHRAGQDVKDAIQVFWKMRDYFDPKNYIPKG